ncbi:MAG: hypothetical protein ACXVJT_12645 [Thermoanaerobaculia bacterium]
MRRAVIALVVAIAACRGESPPRDYQNSPPAMTHPPQTQSQTPTAHGMPQAKAEPSTGVEGQTTKPVDPTKATTTLKDQAPQTQTQTTATR